MYKSKRFLTIIAVSMVLLGLSAQSAMALLVLPNTSYKNGKWQGQREFNSDGFRALVQYSVYDTQNGNEFAVKFGTNPGTGRYVYAYQVFNLTPANETKDIGFFALFGKNQSIAGSTVGDVNSFNPNSGTSKEPTYKYFDEDTNEIVWDFRDSLIVAGSNSWLMAYSSDYAPMVGDFKIEGQQNGEPPVPASVPEPMTITLLGAGAILLMRKK